MQTLRAADRAAVPWKNGGGVTRDVAVSPPGATLATFDWRISIAEIAGSGPFSRFPGIDRRLAVLAGTVALIVEGRGAVVLDPQTRAIEFPGEAAVHANLVGGPSMDLNVMTRRDRFAARMSRRSAMSLTVSASFTVVIALGELAVTGRGGARALGALDALLIEGNAAGMAVGPAGADFYLIELIALRQR